jgi:hypothetical protein
MFGGISGPPTTIQDGLYKLDLTLPQPYFWQRAQYPNEPVGRFGHDCQQWNTGGIPFLGIDATTPVATVFAGQSNDDNLNDFYVLTYPASGSPAWRQIRPSVYFPQPRSSHVMEGMDMSVLVFGGQDALGNVLNDLWIGQFTPSADGITLATMVWITPSITSSQSPLARMSASGSFALGQLWLFGGSGAYQEGTFPIFSDLWSYDILSSGWRYIDVGPTASRPLGRYGHAMENFVLFFVTFFECSNPYNS